jgi:hypothetical protein
MVNAPPAAVAASMARREISSMIRAPEMIEFASTKIH